MNPGRTSCRRLKRDRMRHAEWVGEGGDLGEIHRQGPRPRFRRFNCVLLGAGPACHFSLEIGSAQVQCKTCSSSGKEPGSAAAPAPTARSSKPRNSHSHILRVSDRFIIFGRSAPGPGRPCVQQRAGLPSTSHRPMVSSKLLGS